MSLQGEREMAAYNKTLGRFTLSGIPAAPRGVPQIEVTFDIDANGIVHVSAKDLGTGNKQDITITASGNLSEEEIERAVKEAEQHAAEDKKKREEADIRNNGDQLVYQTEKTMKDLGDKLTEEDKNAITPLLDNLKNALKGTDSAAIKSASEALSQKFYEISSKLYQTQAGGNADAGANQQEAPNDHVYDADYKVVDDDDNK